MNIRAYIISLLLPFLFIIPNIAYAETSKIVGNHPKWNTAITLMDIDQTIKRFAFDSGLHFEYPDAIRGIYVNGSSADGSQLDGLLELVESTDLNAMVIDVKEDFGKLTFRPPEKLSFSYEYEEHIKNPRELLELLEEKQIYPIARIVVFKDTVLAKKRPDLSFTDGEEIWLNNRGEAFVNPFEEEVWEYNIEVAKMAAKLGFQEIQFDYVRFPEGFEYRDEKLSYTQGKYKKSKDNNIKNRVEAVTDFVKYARTELEDYGVKVSVDIFGYAATVQETPGIGQNFLKISDNVDVISSMIYPSHWTSHFGIEFPDKEPYRLVSAYAKLENELLSTIENPPISRPWLQDFEAPWLYDDGPVMQYGKKEVEAQIKALNENNIDEFLLWNAGSYYTKNVNYIP